MLYTSAESAYAAFDTLRSTKRAVEVSTRQDGQGRLATARVQFAESLLRAAVLRFIPDWFTQNLEAADMEGSPKNSRDQNHRSSFRYPTMASATEPPASA